MSAHHRYYSRRALSEVCVELVEDRLAFLSDWCALYENLVRRHDISGPADFMRENFQELFRLEELVIVKAVAGERVVGAHLWMRQGDVVHSHLAASSDEGYALSCAYAIHWKSLEYFAESAAWLNLGGVAGLMDEPAHGLRTFKKGWSTNTRPAWFCASIFQPEIYRQLCGELQGETGKHFFPGYRNK